LANKKINAKMYIKCKNVTKIKTPKVLTYRVYDLPCPTPAPYPLPPECPCNAAMDLWVFGRSGSGRTPTIKRSISTFYVLNYNPKSQIYAFFASNADILFTFVF